MSKYKVRGLESSKAVLNYLGYAVKDATHSKKITWKESDIYAVRVSDNEDSIRFTFYNESENCGVIVKIYDPENPEDAGKSIKPVFPVDKEIIDSILSYHNTKEEASVEVKSRCLETALDAVNNMIPYYNDIVLNRVEIANLPYSTDDDLPGGFRVDSGDKGLINYKLKDTFCTFKIVIGSPEFLAEYRANPATGNEGDSDATK